MVVQTSKNNEGSMPMKVKAIGELGWKTGQESREPWGGGVLRSDDLVVSERDEGSDRGEAEKKRVSSCTSRDEYTGRMRDVRRY